MYSISPSSWTSLPTPHPSSSSQSTELSFLCHTAGFHWLSILHTAVCVCVHVCVSHSVVSDSLHMDCSPPGPSVHGILQARTLEWVAVSFSERSSRPRDRTWVSCIAGRFFTIWATREAPVVYIVYIYRCNAPNLSHLPPTPWFC